MKRNHVLFAVLWSGLAIAAAIAGTGCGKFVTGVAAKTYLEQGDQYAQVDVDLATRALNLSFDLPIPNPQNLSQRLGRVGMKPLVGGPSPGSQLEIAVNLSQAAHLPARPALLPNGRELPIAVKSGVSIITLPIAGARSTVYAGFGDQFALVGTALIISEFDQIAGYLGGANVFLPFQFQNGIYGVAGVFTGFAANQSGLAVFVDISAAFKPVARAGIASALMSSVPGSPIESASGVGSAERVQFDLGESSPDNQYIVLRELDRLNRKGAKLHLQ